MKKVLVHKIYELYDNGDIIKCSKWARRGGKKMSPVKTKKGYLRIQLVTSSGKKSFMVHRLVGLHFIKGKTEKKKYINHIDGNKMNNLFSNLEWVSHSENMKHAYKNGLLKNRRTLNDAQVKKIRESGLSLRNLGKLYHLSNVAIKKIKDYKTYA